VTPRGEAKRMKVGIVVPYSWSFRGGVVEHAVKKLDYDTIVWSRRRQAGKRPLLKTKPPCQAQPKSAPLRAVEKCATGVRGGLVSAGQAESRSDGA
jgi:hypothetical protein